jgi:hypothetical protein
MKVILKFICIFLTILTTAVAASAITINFDDLNSGFATQPLPAGYKGFQWSNFAVANGSNPASPYHNGVVSPNNVVFDIDGRDAEISGGLFDLDSAYLSIPFSILNGLPGVLHKVSLEVQGYLDGSLIYDNTYDVISPDATLFNFDYLGVNDVKFIPTLIPTIINPLVAALPQPVFVMDNLTINTPDSAATFLLLGLSCSLLAFAKRNFPDGKIEINARKS